PRELPAFLDPAEWRIGLEWGEVAPEAGPILAAAARRIADDPVLLRLVWHTYRLVYHHPEYSGFGEWPSLDEAVPGGTGLLALLLALGSVPRMRAAHRVRGVPGAVTRDTSRDLGITVRRYRAISGGRVGIESRLLSWFQLHATGELYRLGRLQYVVGPFRGKLRAYRHSGTGRVLALAEEGVHFNEEGYIDSGAAADPERGWMSHLIEDE